MELHLDAMLYSDVGNEKFHAGHIKCSHGQNLARRPQVPTPALCVWPGPQNLCQAHDSAFERRHCCSSNFQKCKCSFGRIYAIPHQIDVRLHIV